MSGLRRALVALAVAGFALGLGGARARAHEPEHDDGETTTPFIVLALTLGWGFIGAGLLAWWHRPEHRLGPMMTLVGFTWFLGAPAESGTALGLHRRQRAARRCGSARSCSCSSRSRPAASRAGLERWLVRLGWACALIPPLFLFGHRTSPETDCPSCPANELLLWDSRGGVRRADARCSASPRRRCSAGLCLVLVRRWRAVGHRAARGAHARAGDRRADRRDSAWRRWPRRPPALDGIARVLDVALLVLVTAVPFAFLAGLLRSRLSRAGAVSALVERLGGASVRDALADALGDPTLDARVLAAAAGPLRRRGRAARRSCRRRAARAAATEIVRGGVPVAAIVHDAALLEEPALVRAAGAAAALLLENERLDAELRARYDELRASRARLVAAGDAARRRLERDLHDGAQQRFVALALKLRLARQRRRTRLARGGACSTRRWPS